MRNHRIRIMKHDRRMVISKSALSQFQTIEVHRAIKLTEPKMELLKRLVNLDWETKEDVKIGQMQSHIKKVKRRVDACTAYVKKQGLSATQRNNQLAILSKKEETPPENVQSPKRELDQAGPPTTVKRKILVPAKRPSIPPAPTESPQRTLAQTEPRVTPEGTTSTPSPAESMSTPVAPTGSMQSKATGERSKVSAQDHHVPDCRPLPPHDFPSVLPAAALSLDMPPRMEITLAYIVKPPSVGIKWHAVENDPAATPPMDSYSVYTTLGRTKEGEEYPDWNIRTVKATPLPMIISFDKEEYMCGRRLYCAVVGKDKFGRYGPYSSIKQAKLP